MIRDELRNILLLGVSILFYWYGQGSFILPLIGSILLNYIIGLAIESLKNRHMVCKIVFIIGVISNVIMLYVFKYLNFTIDIINKAGRKNISALNIILPIGLSFFTFKAISYLADIYMGKSGTEKNLFNFALYISFFPQIMSGPIARYSDFKDDLVKRKFNIDEISIGVERFICGLGKKLILSNTFAVVADKAFSSVGSPELTVCLSWLGSVFYTLQIYFDFSGYSDMAIGIGNMIGFRCKENFDYPYISKTGTEFWRRWHISLSSWFRDYVYFPLGGSRVDRKYRLFINLSAVWLLTGIWHGANWTFIIWGIFWLVIQVIEKFILHPEKFIHTYSKIIYRIITLLLINFGWVIFRSADLNAAAVYIKTMLGWNRVVFANALDIFLLGDNFVILVIGFILSTPIMTIVCRRGRDNLVFKVVEAAVLTGLFLVCISYSISVTYNPFIYFDF